MNDRIKSKLIPPMIDEDFRTKGLTFTVESTHETQKGTPDLEFDVLKIDIINNPEYEKVTEFYRHPVFFKSAPYGMNFADQGFVDNGRQIINIGTTIDLDQGSSKASINNIGYDGVKQSPRKSIKDRI